MPQAYPSPPEAVERALDAAMPRALRAWADTFDAEEAAYHARAPHLADYPTRRRRAAAKAGGTTAPIRRRRAAGMTAPIRRRRVVNKVGGTMPRNRFLRDLRPASKVTFLSQNVRRPLPATQQGC